MSPVSPPATRMSMEADSITVHLINTVQEPRWRAAASGFILGVLLWIGARELGIRGIPFFRPWHLFLAAGILGAALALTRARITLWIAGAAICLILFTVGYTPLAALAVRSWMRS